jgi:hypothetical protein
MVLDEHVLEQVLSSQPSLISTTSVKLPPTPMDNADQALVLVLLVIAVQKLVSATEEKRAP